MPGPGLHLCQQCQLGALPSHISHSALAGMCLQSPHPPEHRALSFLPFPDNKEFLKAPELPRGRLAPCHGVATGHRRSQGQPHIPVPSSTGMRAVTHVPHWLLLPLASPSQGSSCSHAPCSEQGTAEAQPYSCRGTALLLQRLSAHHTQTAGAGPGLLQHGHATLQVVLCEEIIHSMSLFKHTQQLWEDVVSVSQISEKCLFKCLI